MLNQLSNLKLELVAVHIGTILVWFQQLLILLAELGNVNLSDATSEGFQ